MATLSIGELAKRNNFTIFRDRIRTNGKFTISESNGKRVQITQKFAYEFNTIQDLERFKDNDNVNLWLGVSYDTFPDMMKRIDKKSCFWLDAHGEGGGVPTFNELEEIAKNPIKDHTIIIDDVPEYFKGADKFRLEKELLAINPNYKLQYYKSINRTDDYVLAAYIE